MKSRIKSGAETSNAIPCYYMPKSFLTDSRLSEYSSDSKLLVGIMLSIASDGESMLEAAKLINDLGISYLNKTINKLKQEVGV
jgi:hypothetical protein